MMVKDGQLSYVASSESTISLRLTASTANPARLTLPLFPNTTDLTLSIIVRSSNMLGRIYKFMIGIEALWIPKILIILFIYPTIFPRVLSPCLLGVHHGLSGRYLEIYSVTDTVCNANGVWNPNIWCYRDAKNGPSSILCPRRLTL